MHGALRADTHFDTAAVPGDDKSFQCLKIVEYEVEAAGAVLMERETCGADSLCAPHFDCLAVVIRVHEEFAAVALGDDALGACAAAAAAGHAERGGQGERGE